MKPIAIDGRAIGRGEPAYIVAEIGVNHNGDPALARELIEQAKEAGADAAKLQLFVPEELAGAGAALCSYQRASGAADQLSMLRELALPAESLEDLRDAAAAARITLFASVFDLPSVERAVGLRFPAIKVGSGELTCLPLHEAVRRVGKPVLLSCGMATVDEIRPAVYSYCEAGAPLILLHCVSSYPAPEDELNLRSIQYLSEVFGVPVGFSDHTLGTSATCLAVACGAVVIEKHLTLDRDLPGPDHQASLDPCAFEELVDRVREAERALGREGVFVAPAEREVREKARKSIVLARPKRRGEQLVASDLACRRPGTGISPLEIANVVGAVVARDLPEGHVLGWEDLAG